MATKTTWAIDPNHSDIRFKVRHLMISAISCTFKVFSGEVTCETEDFNNSMIHVEINAASINTDHAERDVHLKSPLFLNVEKHPKIYFTGFLKKKKDVYELSGDLNLCGVTKNITLLADFIGTCEGLRNETRAGFEVSGKINRRDFDLNFNLMTAADKIVVGDELALSFNIEIIKQDS